MYRSPIRVTYPSWDVMCDAITEAVDDAVVTTVKGLIAITVDEEELRRALEYDRDQYAAGFDDGYEYAKRELTEEAKE